MNRIATCCVLALLAASGAEAHVTIQPRESRIGVSETYTMRVPTEGTVATTSVELEVPAGVTIVSVDTPSANHTEKKVGDRVTAITWIVDIQPGQSQQITFIAKNPSVGSEIAWKVHQRYTDGTSSDWTDPPGSRRPGPVTKLVSGE